MTELVNLTGHNLTIIGQGKFGDERVLLPSKRQKATVASLMYEEEWVQPDFQPTITVPILHITERDVRNLPRAEDRVLYVVSGIVAAYANREDVVAPGRTQRDDRGRIEGCRALIRVNTIAKRRQDGG